MVLNKWSHYLFFHLSTSWYAAFFAQQKQPSKVTENRRSLQRYENKTNFITDIFFPKYYSDLGLLRLSSREFFSEYFLKGISKLWTACSRINERSVRFGVTWKWHFCIAENDQKVPFRDPLKHKSKVNKSLAAITFVRSRYSRS